MYSSLLSKLILNILLFVSEAKLLIFEKDERLLLFEEHFVDRELMESFDSSVEIV
jgi:hypothetical protein